MPIRSIVWYVNNQKCDPGRGQKLSSTLGQFQRFGGGGAVEE